MAVANTGPPGPSTLEPMLRKLEYWHKFDDEDRAAVLALPHVVRTLEHNHYIVRELDRASHSCVLLSGYAIRHKIVAGGARQICSVHMKGDIVDLQNSLLGIADHSVQMLTAGKVAMVPREAVERIAFERPSSRQSDVDRHFGRRVDLPRVDRQRRPARCAHAGRTHPVRIFAAAKGCRAWANRTAMKCR